MVTYLLCLFASLHLVYLSRADGLFAKTRLFDEAAVDPLVLQVTERVLGTKCINLSAPTAISIGPGEQAQVPHRDDGKVNLIGNN